ncbi:hypothetical protein OAA19_00710 [Rubripirellula sp.]|nr:hypothetical protein [Rubripirellula sp.]MDB4338608.1 hypothetical protein [Rubripirellula sp.]
MTTAFHDQASSIKQVILGKNTRFLALIVLAVCLSGCGERAAPIEPYVISTKVPSEFLPQQERMLAAMFPKGDQVWFFKIVGPVDALAGVEETFQDFVENISFQEQGPDLTQLPEDWRRSADKPMRFASVSIETPEKQLDLSISSLTLQEDWDQQVSANVNRWRGQLKLDPSAEPLAGGAELEVAEADRTGVWVDFVGKLDDGPSSMVPPFAGMNSSPPAASLSSQPETPTSQPKLATNDDSRVRYERPDGWRNGKASSMRLASFDTGPEEAVAEMSVIIAGGDLRGNVARWLGQVRSGEVADTVIDEALADAEKIEVDGRAAQRFLMGGSPGPDAKMIDATIVPLADEQSLFIKMTGPTETVKSQSKQVVSFLQSLRLTL